MCTAIHLFILIISYKLQVTVFLSLLFFYFLICKFKLLALFFGDV